mgnify:CR=1 FL=1
MINQLSVKFKIKNYIKIKSLLARTFITKLFCLKFKINFAAGSLHKCISIKSKVELSNFSFHPVHGESFAVHARLYECVIYVSYKALEIPLALVLRNSITTCPSKFHQHRVWERERHSCRSLIFNYGDRVGEIWDQVQKIFHTRVCIFRGSIFGTPSLSLVSVEEISNYFSKRGGIPSVYFRTPRRTVIFFIRVSRTII